MPTRCTWPSSRSCSGCSLPGRTASADESAHRARDRFLVAAAVVFGLPMGNHSLTLLLAPAIALFVLAVDPASSAGRG